jgi:hypothetical protein
MAFYKGSLDQHYPPGTQKNYNSFASINIMMDNELEFPNVREGVRGNRGFPLA